MDAVEKVVRLHLNERGVSPFEKWFDRLADFTAKGRILARIARLRSGNAGDLKSVGDGVFELRIDHGPGYRIYFGKKGDLLVILLLGGTKNSQRKDIQQAKDYWNDYEEIQKTKEL